MSDSKGRSRWSMLLMFRSETVNVASKSDSAILTAGEERDESSRYSSVSLTQANLEEVYPVSRISCHLVSVTRRQLTSDYHVHAC